MIEGQPEEHNASSGAIMTGEWRGRVNKTLDILESGQKEIGSDVKALQTQVTTLVVKFGLLGGIFTIVASIVTGLVLSYLHK